MSLPSKTIKTGFLKATQHKTSFSTLVLSAADITRISYVARRGEDEEEGAVQRILNPSRIASIRDFILAGGVFPTSIVLNWTNDAPPLKTTRNMLTIPLCPRSAQIIDGQHRVLGLAAAIEKNKSIGQLELPVSLYKGLSTKDSADIFLSINTEQKPVHRSLVFDLYKVASNYVIDPAALRAGDLASELNEAGPSPYRGYIKFPGTPKGQKGLALSTIVSALKPLVEDKGVFEQVGLTELPIQTQFLINFFSVLRDAYGADWELPTNVFRMAAGFVGAIEFIKNKLVVHCNITGDFTKSAISKVLPIEVGSLIRRDAIEGLQGRRAFNQISESLEALFDPQGSKRKIKV